MIPKSRFNKIEKKIRESRGKNYQYVFLDYEAYEQGKAGGIVDPDGGHIVILSDVLDKLEKEN